jgi:hypothetical protein
MEKTRPAVAPIRSSFVPISAVELAVAAALFAHSSTLLASGVQLLIAMNIEESPANALLENVVSTAIGRSVRARASPNRSRSGNFRRWSPT